MEKLFKIGELSKLYHIGVDSLRYYEEIGLIAPKRSESGYRLYRERDLWRLNVIRDLRELGFPTEAIKRYLDVQNVETALTMLEEEREAIDHKMETLQKLRRNVETRMNNIRHALQLPLNEIILKEFPERRCHLTPKGYRDEHEMDLRIKELVNKSPDQLYIIGNNQFGSVIPVSSIGTGELVYQSVFAIDPAGSSVFPGGQYLTVSYQGDYGQSKYWSKALLDYGASHGMVLGEEMLELLWIDVHTSQKLEEHLTELQILVRQAQKRRSE